MSGPRNYRVAGEQSSGLLDAELADQLSDQPRQHDGFAENGGGFCRSMRKHRNRRFYLIVVGLAVAAIIIGIVFAIRSGASSPDAPVDPIMGAPNYIVFNGTVHTVEEGAPPVTAFVVSTTGRILAVGNASEIFTRSEFALLPMLDLKGSTVIPGIADAHAHLQALGLSFIEPDFSNATSIAEVINTTMAYVRGHGLDPEVDPGYYVMGRGWDQNRWLNTTSSRLSGDSGGHAASAPFPTAADLDEAFPVLPLALERVDGHAVWVNSATLRLIAPIPADDPEGGEIVRDPVTREPTGVFLDNAMDLVYNSSYATIEPATRLLAIRLALAKCASLGITAVHDASMEVEDFEVYKDLLDEGRAGDNANTTRLGKPRIDDQFPLRLHGLLDMVSTCPPPDYTCEEGYPTTRQADAPAMSRADAEDDAAAWRPLVAMMSSPSDVRLPLVLPTSPSPAHGRAMANAVKLFMDGALGSWGAAMLAPYSDKNTTGILKFKFDDYHAHVERAMDQGFQVCTHAIGDKANRWVLDAYELSLAGNDTRKARRHRVEHLQVIDLTADMPRLRDLGVLPSMQPTHATSDMVFAEARLGPARLPGAYAWRTVLATAGAIPLGTDFPVERPDPMRTFHAAITRQNEEGLPAGGWQPQELLSRQQALRGMTLDAAFGAHRERELGSIEVGKIADFVVLDTDIMTREPLDALAATVLATFVDGNAVYVKADVDAQEAALLAARSTSPSSPAGGVAVPGPGAARLQLPRVDLLGPLTAAGGQRGSEWRANLMLAAQGRATFTLPVRDVAAAAREAATLPYVPPSSFASSPSSFPHVTSSPISRIAHVAGSGAARRHATSAHAHHSSAGVNTKLGSPCEHAALPLRYRLRKRAKRLRVHANTAMRAAAAAAAAAAAGAQDRSPV